MMQHLNNEKPPLHEQSPPTYLEMTNIANKYAKLIEVSIEFLSLGEIDTMSERYEAEVRIRSRWYDDEEIDEYEVGAFYDDEDDRRFQQSGDDPHHLKTNNRGDKHFEYSTSPVGEMIVAADDSTHDMDDRSDEDLYYEDEYEVSPSISTIFSCINSEYLCL